VTLRNKVPLLLAGRQIGWLAPALAARLAGWPEVFRIEGETVSLLRHEAIPAVVEQLATEGLIPGWRNERYRVEDLFEVERAAARPFGFTTHAVHVNGVVPGSGMWMARRSLSKPTDPGLLDNLVGGGMTAGLSPMQVLVKEAWEEAGIEAGLARRASARGSARILREVAEGVQSEIVHIYDLELPAGFAPRNQDGEVSEFLLLPFERVMERDLTLEARLAAQDYFSRTAG
jgi:8-oxo-dGTP pyrophosphatase MutT (NUDIX family)